MFNPIDNLGDYGTFHEDLAKYGGSKQALYDAIRQSGVDEVKPQYTLLGGVLGAAVTAIGFGIANFATKRIKRQRALNEAKRKALEETLYAKVDEQNILSQSEDTDME